MKHPTNTHIIFANSFQEAKKKYQSMDIKTKDPKPNLECFKVTELDDFDLSEDFNFVGEISVSPPIMETIRKDPSKAFVLYCMESITH